MKIYLILFFSFMNCFDATESYKILLGVPVASKSLHHLFSSIGVALAEANHSVTLFTSFKQTKKHANLIHFQPDDFSAPISVKPDNIFFNNSYYTLFNWISESSLKATDLIWTNENVWKLYKQRNEFDAIITPSYANEPILPFLDGYRGVYMMVCTPGVEYDTISRTGHWLPASVVPDIFLPYDEQMNFWERSLNLFTMLTIKPLIDNLSKSAVKTQLQKYHRNVDDLVKYYERSSLTLINGHFALDGPVPLLPNQVEIGTINAQKPRPLPKDLESFIEGAGEAGVIYFSLGSFVMGNEIPRHLKDILVEAFGQLPQRVIWKYEDDDLNLPPNVMTRKWLPQQDILGHPNTKIFMSHCGNLGTQEAKFHGVPILAVPIAFDQPRNAARLVRKGYAVLVQWTDMSVQNIVQAVQTLTKDSTYYNRLKSVSRILQDQKDTPADRAVWWVEYVIRHKGAPHLEYAGKRLHLLQYLMVDVLVFWGAVLSMVLFSLVWTCRGIWRKCCINRKTKKD